MRDNLGVKQYERDAVYSEDPGYLRIATEEAYAPAEMLRLYRKLLDEKGTDGPRLSVPMGIFPGPGRPDESAGRAFP